MTKKHVLLTVCLFLAVLLLTACGQATVDPDVTVDGQTDSQLESVDSDSTQEETETRTITDMAGRTVTLPAEVSTGLGTGSIGSYMLYTLDPDTMVGVNYEFNEQEKAYILPEYQDLPSFGQGDGLNLEAVIAAAPDVLISYGTISESIISEADGFQEQTGIPCVVLDGSMEAIPEAYRMLGQVFGMEETAEELAVYAEEALAFAEAIDIPEEEQVTVYFGNGLENLETAPVGSSHAELLDIVDAKNVAVVEGEVTSRIDVSAEQVIGWNPQVILLNGEPTEGLSPQQAVEAFLADSRYENLQAVQNGAVYAIPKYPYSWFDRPPGPNRLIGIYWLAELLYPEQFDLDIKESAKEFYALYYHMDLTEEQLVDLLGY